MNVEAKLAVEYRSVDSLHRYPRNARTHTKHQVRQISASLKAFGFTNPILVDRTGMIIAGHGRLEAAKLLGMMTVPTILLESLTPDQIRAYAIADNKLAENAGWDKAILAIELQHLLTVSEDFDVTITGFEVPEIDLIVQEGAAVDPADTLDGTQEGPAICQPGDLWQLGHHKILCGSALEEASFASLMATREAQMAFLDPPYNVVIDGNVSGKGAVKHSNFAMASGEMDRAEFTEFLTRSLGLVARHSAPGSVHFVCQDWRHLNEILQAGEKAYDSLLNLCVWVKDNGGQGSFYRSQHELVLVFRNGKAKHRNNIQLGKFGRYRTNVWEYPAVRGLAQQQTEEGNLLALHPTVKPVALISDAILDCSAPGDLILDAFLGSGSTLISAERTGRTCYGIELDPRYVDVAIRRWQQHTGQRATHAASGSLFGEESSKGGRIND